MFCRTNNRPYWTWRMTPGPLKNSTRICFFDAKKAGNRLNCTSSASLKKAPTALDIKRIRRNLVYEIGDIELSLQTLLVHDIATKLAYLRFSMSWQTSASHKLKSIFEAFQHKKHFRVKLLTNSPLALPNDRNHLQLRTSLKVIRRPLLCWRKHWNSICYCSLPLSCIACSHYIGWCLDGSTIVFHEIWLHGLQADIIR